jgi:hypothetical protein
MSKLIILKRVLQVALVLVLIFVAIEGVLSRMQII